MKESVVFFEKVSKSYLLYHYVTIGIKSFLFNLPKALHSLRLRFEVFHDVSFEVYRGETFGVIGDNGAGKSTLLGLIAGVLRPSTGKVIVKGRVSPFLELGAGFHPELTGRENIMLNGILMGLTKREVLGKMNEIVKFSELEGFIEQPIRTYSSGMLARLGFSVVAHLDPEILLIDEILAVGDMAFQKKCIEKMMGFKKNGVTMIFVSHSLPDIEKMCDRVMWIDSHTIRMIDTPNKVVRAYIETH